MIAYCVKCKNKLYQGMRLKWRGSVYESKTLCVNCLYKNIRKKE